MIKFVNLSPKLLAIASYYTQILTQFDKFSLFFLSPYSYAKLSKNITNFLIFDGNGIELESDVSEEYLAIACPECDHPLIASSKEGKRGNCEENPSICKGCGETYFMDIRKKAEKLYVFNIRELNAYKQEF